MLGNIILLFIIMYMCAKFPTFAGIVASIMTGAGIAITYFFAKSMFFYSPDDPSKLFNDQTMTLWFLSSLFLMIPMVRFIKKNNAKGNSIFNLLN